MMDKLIKMDLATARKRVKLTQVEAASKIGITVDTLGNYERGKTFPDVPIIKKIEDVYGIPYGNLIFLPEDYDKTVNRI